MPYQSIVKKSPKNQIFRTQIFTIKIFANLAQFQPTQATQRNRRRAAANQAKIGLSLILGRRGCRASGLILKKLVFFENVAEKERELWEIAARCQIFTKKILGVLGGPKPNFGIRAQKKFPRKNFQKKFPAIFSRSQLLRKFVISKNLWYNIRGIYFGWRALFKFLPLKMNIHFFLNKYSF